ncbi:MAG: class I SAM-dependent methyltransferase [Thermoplasmata archaeon]
MQKRDIIEAISEETGIPKDRLPRRFEIIGKSIIMSLIDFPEYMKYKIAKSYVTKFKLWSFYELVEIKGQMRVPEAKLIYGINTDVTHIENGILFRLNPSKVMFSKGNKYERHRLLDEVKNDEIVVDMFAGIGYYSIPLSSRVKKIYACEINPDSYHFLIINKMINKSETLIPYFGDSSFFPLEGVADRVIMGHFDSLIYLNKGLSILKNTGIIHLHALVKRGDETINNYLVNLQSVRGVKSRIVKSYSPSTNHMVFDLHIEKE